MTAAPTQRPAVTRRVVSTAHGPLRRVLLWFPHEVALRPGYRAVYADLFAKLPPATRLTVLVHPRAADVLDELLTGTGRHAANRAVWEELGFTVHELTSFHAFTQRFGALHCIAKELDRRSD